jgi:putative ABC transport system permease protein
MRERIRRLWNELVRGDRLDQEAQDELAHHVELAAADRERAGLDPGEALRQARLDLGDPEVTRERLREGRAGYWVDSAGRDVAYALRMLRKRPGFSAVCVSTVALGVGASTALFAVVDAVVLRPLPLPEPGQLVRIYDTNPSIGIERTGVTSGNFADWRRRTGRLRGLAGHYTMGRTLTVGSDSEVVLAAQVTEDFFPLLGVRAALGRTFTPEETAAARYNLAAAPLSPDPVVVLAHGLWQGRFGGDPGVVGRTVLLERRPTRVVGVMPAGFAFPGPDVQVFLPWGFAGEEPRDQHYLSTVARLGEGVSLLQAEEGLRAVAGVLALEHPTTNTGWSVKLVPLQEDMVGDAGRTLFVLLGAVALLLLVACANVALLFLARGLERGHEASIRLALGATRARVFRQFLVEGLLVAAAGGVLGSLVAVGSLGLLRRMAPGLPRLHEVALDPRALLFAGVATTAAALVSGLPSAWRRARADPASELAGTPSRVAGGRLSGLRDGLVVAEVAIAVILLAGASLLVRSYRELQAVDPGFDPRGVLVAPIYLDMEAYGSAGKSRVYYATLMERLEALPGVLAVGGATALPASTEGPDFERPVWPEEGPGDERARRLAWVRMVTPGYFRTLGMRVVEGRAFDERESPTGPRAVMLSRSLAAWLWPDGSAVGRRLVVDYSASGTYPYEVVGVVNDVRFEGPRSEPRHEIYLPHAQRPYLVMNVALRAEGDPRRLAPAVRAVLHDLDPGKPAHAIQTLEDLLGATYSRDRHAMVVLSCFAAVAALLALLGIHGILSHRVRERAREIGIRMAIGAGRGHLLRWIAGQGLRLALAGALLGGALAAVAARAVSGLLFGVSAGDPVTALAVTALPVVAALVSLLPAGRATRIDAAEVLRAG